jgi:hypothetical protein
MLGGDGGGGAMGAVGGVGARGGTGGANAGAAGMTSGGVSGGAGAGAGADSGGKGAGGAGGKGGSAGSGGSGGSPLPATFKVFDQIPQFGIYATSNPSYTPPSGVLMWSFGTIFVAKLTDAQKTQVLATLAVRLTYHAQCDNYDRLGSLFFVAKPTGDAPTPTEPRVEIVRYITPFSDYNRGALATYVFPDADVSAYAATLADASKDVWIGIQSGANPYDGDPCTNAAVTPEFRQVGYKFSVEFVASGAAVSGSGTTLSAKSYASETTLPISGTFANPAGTLTGRVTVIVSGHGSAAGGDEYMNTMDTVSVNGSQVGAFSTAIDCAPYARYSPDGNPGIFRNNTTTNPRNWCPGSLVAPHTYPVTLNAGTNTVTLGIAPSGVPSGSFYATTLNFTSP